MKAFTTKSTIRVCSLFGLMLISSWHSVYAESRNDVKSCYDFAKIAPQTALTVDSRHLFVAIDSTFSPDLNIKKLVHEKVHSFLRPGDELTIISFSAYVQDLYTNVLFRGKLDTDIKERSGVSKKLLMTFDNCMNKQTAYVKRKIDSHLKNAFKLEGVDVPKTEIISNLSQVIAPIMIPDNSTRRVLLLVSDMVENSDVTSFYANNNLKTINPEQEIAKVQKASMLGDFNRAEVYVLGAGWLPKNVKGFRGGETMMPLKLFWSKYFETSNAKLKAFGQPILMVDM